MVQINENCCNTGSLSITNGAGISALTGGQGNGGNITINTRDTVTFDGGENGLSTSIDTAAASNSMGNAGNIRINARELFVKNGATLNANTCTDAQGNAGNIFIDTRDDVTFDVTNGKNSLTGVFTYARGVGKGGDIQITTDSLTLSNGAILLASSFGKGNAGEIIVNAGDAIRIDGVGRNGISSGVSTTLRRGAEGRGGNINLTTDSLFLTNGGIVNASTYSRGNGGDITIDARDRILIDGVGTTDFSSGIFSAVSSEGVGNGGNINLTTDSLFLNRGVISSSSVGQGKAGDININSDSTKLTIKELLQQ
ncbi:hypothetical protein IQ276_021260 [Desmonostoc muscorum LEGE 12446]|uniref:S-layer family protein n=1 Tax=Desmonostoc muscorum LEGE 12446 TaxID=1828758 RepID=A0A8J7D2V6_DESMC|nr:S-layer family protein [Desmonostoc muscorum]MCF2148908.1 hypothetical protein [Desmonostoc muscorum LEGE 12446]